MPRQIIRELQNNLKADEVAELFGLFNQYSDCIRIDWQIIPIKSIERFQRLGCKLGDAVVAAHLREHGVHTLISENRHFLKEIPDLPFRVLSAAAARTEMSSFY